MVPMIIQAFDQTPDDDCSCAVDGTITEALLSRSKVI